MYKEPLKWCDFRCEHSDFAKEEALDGSRSCRTFQAVWCEKLKKHVLKNSMCTVKE